MPDDDPSQCKSWTREHPFKLIALDVVYQFRVEFNF